MSAELSPFATNKPYKVVHNEIAKRIAAARKGSRASKSGVDNGLGVAKQLYRNILEDWGWRWVPTMGIGTGCKVHLKASELPAGTIICKLSKHVVCVKDGVIQDTYDCSRGGSRCVYGYWIKEND